MHKYRRKKVGVFAGVDIHLRIGNASRMKQGKACDELH